MARYKMEDGTIVNTENAVQTWEDNTRWDGRNHIHITTGDQWSGQTLYQSKKGRFYVVSWSSWQGRQDQAEWISDLEAARWLAHNSREIPAALADLAEQVSE